MIDLRHGDCLELMRDIPDGSIDAVITDPPYGIGFNYAGGREEHTTPEAYWTWLQPGWVEMMRVLKPGGLFAVWQSQRHLRHYWAWYGDDIRIYAAAKNFTQLRKTPINFGWDPVVMGYKPGAPPRTMLKPRRNIDYFVANTAGVVSDTTRIERRHPCPRPLDAVREIADNFVVSSGVVLDPFMGSGTTGVACVETGRAFIGIEKDANYFALAERRLADADAKVDQLELVV